MKLRKRNLLVPVLALVGLLLALYFLFAGQRTQNNAAPLPPPVPSPAP
jgi:hypothetical protein